MTDEPLLRVSKLSVQFGGKELFRDLTFELKTNETLVVLGPNGSGKTVLLRALLGLVPHEGEVIWKEGVKVGYVPQRVPLNRDLPLTVEDFFALKGVNSVGAAKILSQVGISDPAFQKQQLGLLSSGQFQRVLIAWALVSKPDVLLFDEPTAGIDVGGEETIHDLLRKAHGERKFAVVLVTHDLSTVYGEATAVLCLSHRRTICGTPKEVLDPQVLREIYGREIKFFRHSDG